jgi:DNA-binding MarR family transcriptional regulator
MGPRATTTIRRPGTQVSTAEAALRLREAITRFNRRLRRTRPAGDLTITQISALQSLESAGALTPRELADIERVSPPTMTRIVARLEERALVRRTPHPTDGRQVILAPTAAGLDVLTEYRRVRDEWLADRIATLSPDERKTILHAAEILSRIAKD